MRPIPLTIARAPNTERQEKTRHGDANMDFEELLKHVYQGKQEIVCFAGISQYSGSSLQDGLGASACGLAALNFARIAFELEEEGHEGIELLRRLVSPRAAAEITSICASWKSNAHLEVEDLLRVPLFNTTLDLSSFTYRKAERKSFQKCLIDLLKASPEEGGCVAAIITRPPEILACLKVSTTKGDIYVVFDSHPRPIHPHGCGLVLNTSLDAAASYLSDILAVDIRILEDSSIHWQAQLLAHFSTHIVLPKRHGGNQAIAVKDSLLEASIAILSLNAEVADLKREKTMLDADNKNYEEHVERLQMEIEKMKADAARRRIQDRGQSSSQPSTSWNINQDTRQRRVAHFSAGSSRTRFDQDANHHGSQFSNLTTPDTQRREESDMAEAQSTLVAAEYQRQFQEEDARLAAERKALADADPGTFDCGVCFEEHQIDHIAKVPGCGHSLCRSCLRNYTLSRLKDRRFPVICPICVAGVNPGDPGIIDQHLIQQLGIPENDYRLFEELQIAAFSIPVHCRKCTETMFVDRQEYQESKIIVCPLPRCNHAWCKICQQTIDVSGPQHSCDGSSELQHLMSTRGWKYCPGCQTPIQKDSGCHHMTCMSPGCNTHFCYLCGQLIVQSATRREIRTAVSAHYRQCTLFEH